MKAVILAGGYGTRLSEETVAKPKPMVEIGDRPILWHIMKGYSAHGINDFIVCLGYKGYVIKEYFAQYFLHTSDVTFDFAQNETLVHEKRSEPWRVTLIDTGLDTQTGGRLLRAIPFVQSDEAFCFTYGDGVSDVNIGELLAFHAQHGRLATVTGVRPPGRFGAFTLDGSLATSFAEKPESDGGLINGGFFVLSPKVAELIDGPDTIWEREPLERLARDSQLMVFRHAGFWQPMDTLREKHQLERLWDSGEAPWKVWD